ncbi:MAG TPA: hypothetical protein VJT75_00855, partial [Thermoleophilaceae bacterium]|nr:hypothetical protein [Thermoleophilaceae bacterium]
LVEHRTLRDSHELWVYDDLAAPPRLAFSAPGRHRSARLECDADSAVIVEPRGARRTAVEIVPLAG